MALSHPSVSVHRQTFVPEESQHENNTPNGPLGSFGPFVRGYDQRSLKARNTQSGVSGPIGSSSQSECLTCRAWRIFSAVESAKRVSSLSWFGWLRAPLGPSGVFFKWFEIPHTDRARHTKQTPCHGGMGALWYPLGFRAEWRRLTAQQGRESFRKNERKVTVLPFQ